MFRDFFRGIVPTAVQVFAPRNLPWHALAAALTALLVLSGADWWYFEHTRGVLQSLTLPAAIAGFFVPILLSVGLYIAGELRKSALLKNTGAALAQAGLVALAVSSLYKVFTGRVQPEFYTHLSNVDVSRGFQFGFLEHGVFWGWPSSHAAVAFAGAVALMLLYPRSAAVRYAALVYALFIGVGVSISIHWLSDAVAGAIVGAVVGAVVARSFRQPQAS